MEILPENLFTYIYVYEDIYVCILEAYIMVGFYMRFSEGFYGLVIPLTIPPWVSVFSMQYALTFIRVEKMCEHKQANR